MRTYTIYLKNYTTKIEAERHSHDSEGLVLFRERKSVAQFPNYEELCGWCYSEKQATDETSQN